MILVILFLFSINSSTRRGIFVLSLVPVMISASGILLHISLSVWGRQPVRTMTESGLSFLAFLTAYNDLLSPEPVTVHEFISMTSALFLSSVTENPAEIKLLFIHSVSYWLTLQPRVMKNTLFLS